MTDPALSEYEKGPGNEHLAAQQADQPNETLYYEMDATIYGVRSGVVFTLSRDCRWKEMGKGSQFHMADDLRMRAHPTTFEGVKQMIQSIDIFSGEVEPL